MARLVRPAALDGNAASIIDEDARYHWRGGMKIAVSSPLHQPQHTAHDQQSQAHDAAK